MKTKPYEHYARLSPQPIEYMRQAMSAAEFRGFCRGNIIKYACRMGYKDSFATCAKKIEDYARWIRQSEQGKPLTWKDNEGEYYGLTEGERKEAQAIAQDLMGQDKKKHDSETHTIPLREKPQECFSPNGRVVRLDDGRLDIEEG